MSHVLETTEDGRFRLVIEQDIDADPSDRQGSGFVYYVEHGRDPHTVATEYDTAGAERVRGLLTEAIDRFPGDLDTVARYFRQIGYVLDYFDDRDGRYIGIATPALAEEWGSDPETMAPDLSEWQARAEGDVWGYVIEELTTWTSNTIGGPREMSSWEPVDYADGALWGMYGGTYAEETAREAWEGFLEDVVTA